MYLRVLEAVNKVLAYDYKHNSSEAGQRVQSQVGRLSVRFADAAIVIRG